MQRVLLRRLDDQVDSRKCGNSKDMIMPRKSELNKRRWSVHSDEFISRWDILVPMNLSRQLVLWKQLLERQKNQSIKLLHSSGLLEDIQDLLRIQHSKNSSDMLSKDIRFMRIHSYVIKRIMISIVRLFVWQSKNLLENEQ